MTVEATLERALEKKRIVLDCRWLGIGGAGTVTELLLADFRKIVPPGSWRLWGRPANLEPFVFPGAEITPFEGDPRELLGQRWVANVPDGNVVVYMHQIRPLISRRSVTVIHDTIPLRYGGNAVTRLLKRRFLARIARDSSVILTDSEHSRRAIERDLGVRPDRIRVMRFPVDEQRAAAVARLRQALPRDDRLLYVGRFAPHKNLHRLCRAFVGTRFAADGGRLVLVGASDAEARAMRDWLAREALSGVEIRTACPADEIDRLLATSRALVLPSLEEGYGLPAFEAAASGLPVAAAPTGAIGELPAESRVLLDPLDVADIGRAIDEAVERPERPPSRLHEPSLREPVLEAVALAAS